MNALETSGQLTIKFKGLDADRGAMDIGHLGESMVGINRLLIAGFNYLDSDKIPSARAPQFISIETRTWRPGSFELLLEFKEALAIAPLLHDLYVENAPRICRNWLSAVFLAMTGKKTESGDHLSQALETSGRLSERKLALIEDTTHKHLELIERSLTDQQKISERLLDQQEQFFEMIQSGVLYGAAQKAVRPLGVNAERFIVNDGKEETEIDVPMAETVRLRGKVEVGDKENLELQVDGFTHHNRQLKVFCPDPEMQGRFSTAVVRDPEFEQVPNVYTEAAIVRGWILAEVKISRYKSGKIHRIYILDAKARD
ncbi:MAG: hypothetical protein OXD36_18125 [Rhodobacter sp.]|nr:hypothetical protein [Rhodobacter sp.]